MLPSAVTSLWVMWLDQSQEPIPRHDLVHLPEKPFAPWWLRIRQGGGLFRFFVFIDSHFPLHSATARVGGIQKRS